MAADSHDIDRQDEAKQLLDCMERGDPRASIHLARLFVADDKQALYPFAEVLAGRLTDHLTRSAEIGITNQYSALEGEVYALMQSASIDWARLGRLDASWDEEAD
jgi:hypothetical protein